MKRSTMKSQIIILGLVLIAANVHAGFEEDYVKDMNKLITKSKESLQRAALNSRNSIYAGYCTDNADISFDLAKTSYALVLSKCSSYAPPELVHACWRNEYASTSGRILSITQTALSCIMNYVEDKD